MLKHVRNTLTLTSFFLLILATPASAATQTVTIDPTDVGVSWNIDVANAGYSFPQDNTAPLGSGALEATTNDFSSFFDAYTSDVVAGTKLSAINEMSYWHYKDCSSTIAAQSTLGIELDVDVYGDDSYYTTLTFHPQELNQGQQATICGNWQFWDAYFAGEGIWRTTAPLPGVGIFSQVTWDTMVAAAGNQAEVDRISITNRQDFFWNGASRIRIDNVVFGANGNTTVWNFEPEVVIPPTNEPTGVADCLGGNWQSATRGDGSGFTNQGQCFKYLLTGN